MPLVWDLNSLASKIKKILSITEVDMKFITELIAN